MHNTITKLITQSASSKTKSRYTPPSPLTHNIARLYPPPALRSVVRLTSSCRTRIQGEISMEQPHPHGLACPTLQKKLGRQNVEIAKHCHPNLNQTFSQIDSLIVLIAWEAEGSTVIISLSSKGCMQTGNMNYSLIPALAKLHTLPSTGSILWGEGLNCIPKIAATFNKQSRPMFTSTKGDDDHSCF